jgi:hypothetical protein
MSGKKGSFQSLSDAADMLKKAFSPKTEIALKRANGAISNPPPAPTANPFKEVERELQKAAEARREKARTKKKNKKIGRGTVQEKTQKGTKDKQGKIILKAPGMKAAYRQYLEEERAKEEKLRAGTQVASQPLVDAANKRRERCRQIRDAVGQCSPTIEPRPHAVSSQSQTDIVRAIKRGAKIFAATPDRDENGYIVGFDFGTSSLKLAVRQPYRAGANVAAMPVPAELRSGGHAYLWQTVLWFDPHQQRFSLIPGPGMEALEGFKTGIIGGHGGQRVRDDLPVTRSEAAIAFVALQLAHFFGWYAEERPLKEAGADHFLSINIGIPVATQDDKRTFTTFRRVVAAARNLIGEADNLTLSRVREAHQRSGDILPHGWEIIPELTAAIAGYAAEVTSQEGAHVLIDVGASTLDIVAFNLVHRKLIAVISAGVELLGAASLEVASSLGFEKDEFRAACDQQFGQVFGDACRPSRGSNGFSPEARRREVQLITTGGGCASPLHTEFIDSKNVPAVLGSFPAVRPEPPSSCAPLDCERSRLLLAYGLTRDVQELLDLKLPSQVPDIPSRPAPDLTFISKDMV